MKKINFSKNRKLNKVLNSIYESLLYMCDTKEESINEIQRYVSEFRYAPDYNLYKYGNLIITYFDIHKLYKDYKSLEKVSDEKIEAIYMRQIRFVVNYILSINK